MKTLIIHPEDSSTFFLDIVYKNIADKTVITGGVTPNELKDLIKSHDSVMMMGHGSNHGLFSIGRFIKTNGFVIDESFVSLLKEKEKNVFIWCHADEFVEKHNLKGFYCGMFISEVMEAYYCGIPFATQSMVNESNYGFCNILGDCINESKDIIHEKVKKEYGLIAENNVVARYNHLRLYKN